MSDGAAPRVRELARREFRKDGRLVARVGAADTGDGFLVAAEVHPHNAPGTSVRLGPYRFATAREAAAVVNDAAEAFAYLGCV